MPIYTNRIAEERARSGLSQTALAKLVGTSQQQIQRLESGERSFHQEWMERIATALKIGPCDLLPYTPTSQVGTPPLFNEDLMRRLVVEAITHAVEEADGIHDIFPDEIADVVLHVYGEWAKQKDLAARDSSGLS